jgi:hypothetical protein
MKKLLVFALLLTLAGCTVESPASDSNLSANNQNANNAAPLSPASAIPYSLTLEGFAIDGFPGLQSSVVAGDPEKLLMFGGRRNGLHGFPGGHDAAKGPSFPKTEANDTIYALDLKNRKLLGSAQVNGLPAKVANQFKATNTEYQLAYRPRPAA